MDVSIVTDYLVEQGEFVDEELVDKLNKLLKYEDREVLRDKLVVFFKSHFPDLDTSSFFSKYFSDVNKRTKVSIIKSFEKTPTKRSVQHFVTYFNIRFKSVERLLKNRSELSGVTSISRVKKKGERETVAIIGMVLDKRRTKNGHIMLTVEDRSGVINVLINKDNGELFPVADDIVLDEVLGIIGTSSGEIVFSDSIIHPDIPLSKELKKSPYDHNAVFLGDFHFGSKEFLEKEFHRFLLWLNGKVGSLEQRRIAQKVRYVFVLGDLIEGVGVYPGQENDLTVKDTKGQYDLVAKYFKKIPSHIKIIICPGNHDVGRLAEPQLPIPKEYAPELWELPNVIMVSNPAYVSVDVSEEFSGIDVLLYHGGSLIYYSDAIPSIRSNGGQKIAHEIMGQLLKRRHLAPSHSSTMYIPDLQEDPLLIDPIPDIFATGHIHRAQSKNYRNVTCLNTSCWTAITEDQEKRGLEPQPGRVMVVSLKTREVKALNFSTTKDVASVAEYKKMKRDAEKKEKQKAASSQS
ncbi:MAG: metallophosphoesterase [Candidatus Woesearchaeota archaeon]